MPSRWLRDHTVVYQELVDAEKRGELPPNGIAILSRAYYKAWRVHLTHPPRKSGEAYIYHPIQMHYTLVVELGVYDVVTGAVALLHDTIEDQLKKTLPLYQVHREFAIWLALKRGYGEYGSPLVSNLVIITRRRPEQDDKELYLRDIEEYGEWEVLLAKLVDRDHNVATLWAVSEASQLKEARMTLKCFPGILRAYLERCPEEHYYDGTTERVKALWKYRIKPRCEAIIARLEGRAEGGDA
jgi:(p)ppGpp synthase/HD superfamily hydrolase